MDWKDRVALVTGGASGIGRATALLLSAKGADVAVADMDVEGGRQLVEDLCARGGRAEFVPADISAGSDVQRMIERTVEALGGLDMLVNNAGICITGSTEGTDEAVWDRVLDVNLKGVWLCVKHALPAMKARKQGAIVNIGSTASLVGFPDLAAYCASKGGVANLTRAMALDAAPFNIRINCICPGHIDTPLAGGFVAAQPDPQAFIEEFILKRHPVGRMGNPEEVAQVAVFLCSDQASFITGAVLAVDGGYTAR